MTRPEPSPVTEHSCWVRLPHKHLRLPLPAVYLPKADLYQQDLSELGFVPEHLGIASLTTRLAADVDTYNDGLILVLSSEALSIGSPIGVDRSTKKVFGLYTEEASRTWRRQVRRSKALLIVAGRVRTPNPSQEQMKDVMVAIAPLAVGIR